MRAVTPGLISWISQEVDLAAKPAEGFLRIVTDSPYRVWINDALLNPLTSYPSTLGYGPWFFREFSRGSFDLALDAPPESLNPDEPATLLPGRQHEIPLGRDPGGNRMIPEQSSPGGTGNHPTTEGVITGGTTS